MDPEPAANAVASGPPGILVLLVFAGLLWYGAVIWLGLYVAGEKNRSGWEGVLLAAVFGPLGVIVEALLPTRRPPEVDPRWTRADVQDRDAERYLKGIK